MSLGFDILSVENIREKPSYNSGDGDNIMGLGTDYQQLEHYLTKYSEEILCVISTTSCFAPRNPDNVEVIGQLARKYKVFHLVNNAYGLQCSKTVDMLNRTISKGLVDYIVQSTDKNFCVPVGGSIGI
jgi:O-phospho-L-seryl-tRNASec:L-selenocysteinyl-tRNA synthase